MGTREVPRIDGSYSLRASFRTIKVALEEGGKA